MGGPFFFWRKWLFVVSIIFVVFGLALAFFNQSPFFDFLFNNQINPTFWGSSSVPHDAELFQQWVYGVLRAMLSGWGIFMAFIAYYPFRAKEKWSWNCIALGVAVWFIVDTAISLYFKVGFNALFNTLFLISIGLPLLFTRKQFDRKR